MLAFELPVHAIPTTSFQLFICTSPLKKNENNLLNWFVKVVGHINIGKKVLKWLISVAIFGASHKPGI